MTRGHAGRGGGAARVAGPWTPSTEARLAAGSTEVLSCAPRRRAMSVPGQRKCWRVATRQARTAAETDHQHRHRAVGVCKWHSGGIIEQDASNGSGSGPGPKLAMPGAKSTAPLSRSTPRGPPVRTRKPARLPVRRDRVPSRPRSPPRPTHEFRQQGAQHHLLLIELLAGGHYRVERGFVGREPDAPPPISTQEPCRKPVATVSHRP